ncbi:MAG TPA: GHKL domain-containing protein [Mobilitalea sp.]|nr:GHKL domain-containing protein [Mobilitalea sp.]
MKEIIYLFYIYITDFIKMWLILWGLFNFKPISKKKIYYISGIVQFTILIINIFIYKTNRDTATFISVFTVVLTMSIIFEGKYIKRLSHSLLSYVFIIFLDACITGIVSLISNMVVLDFINNLIVSFIFNAIDIIIIILIILLKRRKFKSKIQINISKRIYILLFAGALTGSIILATLLTKTNDAKSENIRRIIVVVTIIAIISYNVACIMMIAITESRDNYKALSIISKNIIESQQKYYTLVNEKQQEMRSIRHEMKNHLACIHGLYQANKLSEMELYLRELIDGSDISEALFDTGNDIVNAILNDAQSKCKKDNIIIRLEGGFPEDLQVSPMDLCVIFANTVSNAIEAIQCMDRDEDCYYYIDVRIKSFKDDLFIDVINPVDKNLDVDLQKFNTSKMNKELHGFGVKNIIQKVEKYHGSVNYKLLNNEIFVKIEMKNRA